MKKLIVLLVLVALFCTGCYDCSDCELKDEEILELEWDIDELKSKISDCGEYAADANSDIDMIAGNIYTAIEHLEGFFGEVDVDEALNLLYEATDYIDSAEETLYKIG